MSTTEKSVARMDVAMPEFVRLIRADTALVQIRHLLSIPLRPENTAAQIYAELHRIVSRVPEFCEDCKGEGTYEGTIANAYGGVDDVPLICSCPAGDKLRKESA